MKKLFKTLFLLSLPFFMQAQTAMTIKDSLYGAGKSYRQITAYIDSLAVIDSNITSAGYKEYLRWQSYWADRINALGDSTGSFKYTREAMYKYLNNLNNYTCPSSNLGDNWTVIGPVKQPESHPNLQN